ncbi:DUF6153 family protein [Microbacterium sp. E-13]|uniref:DUF6153 family protein n=1 Tax=Microbacterium sp. E-13 TaxID=3404048 RepID=UPI003CEB49D2
MSLIALKGRLCGGQSTARRLLLLIAFTGAVIIGLLAMHSLNSHTAAGTSHHHYADAAVVSAVDMGHDHSDAADDSAQCADCGTDHSSMLAMTCVLALLAVALLLVCPQLRHRWLSTMPGRQPVVPASGIRASARPPSLSALCISRT